MSHIYVSHVTYMSHLSYIRLICHVISISHKSHMSYIFLDGYCSTVQGLLDWFEVDLGFTKLSFIQIDLCVLCVFVLYSRGPLSSCPFLDILHCLLRAVYICPTYVSSIICVSHMSCHMHVPHVTHESQVYVSYFTRMSHTSEA